MTQPPFRLPGVHIPPRPAQPLRHPLPPSSDMDRLGLRVRAETPDDMAFLRQLYAQSRAAELRMLGWDNEAKQDFVEKQFSYQYLHHSRFYASADFAVITLGGRPVGRMYMHWGENGGRECRLFDFQLLPDCRGRGIGSLLLAALLRQAQALRHAVSLHVEPINGARRLYTRFGFSAVGTETQSGALLMRWNGGPATPGFSLAG